MHKGFQNVQHDLIVIMIALVLPAARINNVLFIPSYKKIVTYLKYSFVPEFVSAVTYQTNYYYSVTYKYSLIEQKLLIIAIDHIQSGGNIHTNKR